MIIYLTIFFLICQCRQIILKNKLIHSIHIHKKPHAHHDSSKQWLVYCCLKWLNPCRNSWFTLSSPYKLSSANFLVCSNIHCASISLKIGENVWVSRNLDPSESLSNSASYPDLSCLHMAFQLWLEGLGLKYYYYWGMNQVVLWFI